MADSDVDTPPYAATCETDACPCNQCRNADVSSYECRGGKDLNARRWAAVELLNPAKSMRPRYEIRLGALDTIRMCGLHLRRGALTLGHDLRASGSSAAAVEMLVRCRIRISRSCAGMCPRSRAISLLT